MFAKVLPINAAMGRVFFRTAVAETVAQSRFGLENAFFQLYRDVDYVANLLSHSALLGLENPFSIWGGGVIRSSDVDLVAGHILGGEIKDEEAQNVADQLLLQFGLFPPRSMWPAEALRIERCGGKLYLQAARIHGSPFREQLESMAEDFSPWTTVIHDLLRRESLLIR